MLGFDDASLEKLFVENNMGDVFGHLSAINKLQLYIPFYAVSLVQVYQLKREGTDFGELTTTTMYMWIMATLYCKHSRESTERDDRFIDDVYEHLQIVLGMSTGHSVGNFKWEMFFDLCFECLSEKRITVKTSSTGLGYIYIFYSPMIHIVTNLTLPFIL